MESVRLSTEWILLMGARTDLNETADLRKAPAKVIAGIGRVLLWNGGSLWIGRAAGPTQAHAHHAIQISLALTGCVRFRTPEGRWSEYSAALIPSHQRHQFDGNGQSVAQLFVEPETLQGRALQERHGGEAITAVEGESLEQVKDSLRRAFATRLEDEALILVAQRAVELLGGGTSELQVDPRITRAIEWLRTRKDSQVSLAHAARIAHLSPSRFRHLFVAQTGISFRAYLLWTRVSAAVGAAMCGQSWTDAAQAWGFADSAHLSRTCRRMFGIAPSSLLREK